MMCPRGDALLSDAKDSGLLLGPRVRTHLRVLGYVLLLSVGIDTDQFAIGRLTRGRGRMLVAVSEIRHRYSPISLRSSAVAVSGGISRC
jgi:hypothetical protein